MRQPKSVLSRLDEQFFEKLVRAKARVLMLDYDGTLAPFRVEPAKALPYAGVRQTLCDILLAGRTRLIIVSGRALNDLIPLLNMDPLPEIWASHGWERRTVKGCYLLCPVPETAKKGLTLAVRRVEEAGFGPQSEVKPASVALHWRGLSSAAAESLKEWCRVCWGSLVQLHGLKLRDFDGGMELRIAGRDKGTAVGTILAESLPSAVVAYLGDDLTDEDAFFALPTDGLGVLVRRELRPTAAKVWIRPPKELLAFLNRWKLAAGGRV